MILDMRGQISCLRKKKVQSQLRATMVDKSPVEVESAVKSFLCQVDEVICRDRHGLN